MDKTIKVTLSKSGIDAALRELDAFQKDFNKRCGEAVTNVAQRGAELIEYNMPSGKTYDQKGIESGSNTSHDITVSSGSGTNPTASVTLKGPDVLFIEFGAGVHYNGTGTYSFGTYAIGSYGQHHGLQDVWGYKSNGVTILSHGTAAAEPVYKTYIELRYKSGLQAAKRAFN